MSLLKGLAMWGEGTFPEVGTSGLLEPDFKHVPVSDKFKDQPLSPACKVIEIHICIPPAGTLGFAVHRFLLPPSVLIN